MAEVASDRLVMIVRAKGRRTENKSMHWVGVGPRGGQQSGREDLQVLSLQS